MFCSEVLAEVVGYLLPLSLLSLAVLLFDVVGTRFRGHLSWLQIASFLGEGGVLDGVGCSPFDALERLLFLHLLQVDLVP